MKYKLLVILLVMFVLSGCGEQRHHQVSTSPPSGSEVPDSPYASVARDAQPDDLCQGDSEVADAVNQTLLTLPRWIRQAFIDSGWEMLVVDYDLATVDYAGQFKEGDVLASTAYKDRQVRILDNTKAAINSPVHEFGHWVDWLVGFPSMYDKVYLDIYAGEAEDYREAFSPVCAWNEQEFFAEGFWCYWKSPEMLKKVCPEFHSFLSDLLKEAREATGFAAK